MGRDKALLPWPPQIPGQQPSNETFLSCAIRSFALSVDFVVVVAGKNQTTLAPVVYANGATLSVNPDPSRGQFSSLQVGLHEVLNRGRDAVLITLVDRPPVSVATIEALLTAFTSAPTKVWAVVPEFSGRHGHPYIAGRELIEAFLRAAPTASAREIEREHHDHVQYLAVDDPFVALNVNTPDEYAALCNSKSQI
jgi:molybdenum cofactor cytidylyltransferase